MLEENDGNLVKNSINKYKTGSSLNNHFSNSSTGRFSYQLMNYARHINPFWTEDNIEHIIWLNKYEILIKSMDGRLYMYDVFLGGNRLIYYKDQLTEEEFLKEFGIRLRKLFERYFKTELELAEYLGIHRVTVSRYARGKNLPNAFIFQKILKFFNIDERELLTIPYIIDKYILGLDV